MKFYKIKIIKTDKSDSDKTICENMFINHVRVLVTNYMNTALLLGLYIV